MKRMVRFLKVFINVYVFLLLAISYTVSTNTDGGLLGFFDDDGIDQSSIAAPTASALSSHHTKIPKQTESKKKISKWEKASNKRRKSKNEKALTFIEELPTKEHIVNSDQTLQQNNRPAPPLEIRVESAEKLLGNIKEKDIKYPFTEENETSQTVEFNFNNVELKSLIDYIAGLYDVTFLTNDAVKPMPQGRTGVSGIKITFKTQVPLTKKEAWFVFIKFLSMAGFTLAPGTIPRLYKIIQQEPANNNPLPSYIGIDYKDLPEDDNKVRYVYFVTNSKLETIHAIATQLISPHAKVTPFSDFNALIFTDKSSNIKSVMEIISELDKEMPESMSVIKLKQSDADDVKKLYKSLTMAEEQQGLAARLFGTGKRTSSAYFPDDTRIISEPRTNSLILLGNRKSIKRIEDFIREHVDLEINLPYSPLYSYQLQYAKASEVAQLLKTVTNFDPSSPAAKYGSVRGGDKFFRPMQITAEPTTNTVVVKAEKEDYLKVRELIEKLDVIQPQVAIEILIVSVTISNTKQLGSQIHNKTEGLFNQNIDFQSAQLSNIVTKAASSGGSPPSLLGNLISLAKGAAQGSTILSVGNAVDGVWGIFTALQKHLDTRVVANPFLVTTNNTMATVSLGNSKYGSTGFVQGVNKTGTKSDVDAMLTVKVRPQISSASTIQLDLDISIDEFVLPANPDDLNKSTKNLQTIATVGNEEVLVLGGMVKNYISDTNSQVPGLGSVPVLGWLLKNKSKTRYKDSILIFVSPKILNPGSKKGFYDYTLNKADHVKSLVDTGKRKEEKRDPIHRWFFDSTGFLKHEAKTIDKFLQQKIWKEEGKAEAMQKSTEVFSTPANNSGVGK